MTPTAEQARTIAVGAVLRLSPKPNPVNAFDALRAATRGNVASVNDNGGHKRVLALFDRAIARLEKTQ